MNWSLITMFILVIVLNIWRNEEFGTIIYWLSTFIIFPLIGWWWVKE